MSKSQERTSAIEDEQSQAGKVGETNWKAEIYNMVEPMFLNHIKPFNLEFHDSSMHGEWFQKPYMH